MDGKKRPRYLVFGLNGWIGSEFAKFNSRQSVHDRFELVESCTRIDNPRQLMNELKLHQFAIDGVLCFIGRTYCTTQSDTSSTPTTNSLEHRACLVDNVRDNLYAPVVLATHCAKLGLSLVYVGTGCIYDSTNIDTKAFTENDVPNFFGSSYSAVKNFTDRIMQSLDETVLNVRIRMCVSADGSSRDLVSKLLRFQYVTDVSNSVSVLPTLFPALSYLIRHKIKGTINLCNDGVISHREILELYKRIVDPSLVIRTFSLEEEYQKTGISKCNNQLGIDKLKSIYPGEIPSAHAAVSSVLHLRKSNLANQQMTSIPCSAVQEILNKE